MYKKGLHRFSKPWMHYQKYSTIPRRFRSYLPCGYSRNQLWIGLCRAWNAFTIWKQEDDVEMMQKYGRIIHNIQRKLKISLTEFDLIIGDEYKDENDDDDDDNNDYEGSRMLDLPKTDEELLAD